MAQPAAISEPLAPATLTDMLDGGWRLLHRQPGTILGLSAMFLVPLGGAGRAGVRRRRLRRAEHLRPPDLRRQRLLPARGPASPPSSASALRSLGVLYLGVALTHVVLAASSGSVLGAGAAARAAPAPVRCGARRLAPALRCVDGRLRGLCPAAGGVAHLHRGRGPGHRRRGPRAHRRHRPVVLARHPAVLDGARRGAAVEPGGLRARRACSRSSRSCWPSSCRGAGSGP